MKNLKRKVKNAFELYKLNFKDEYDLVIVQIKQYRDNQKTEWGEITDDFKKEHSLKREMFRVPETLYNLILMNLSDEEKQEMDSTEYARWFVSEFPQFKVTKNE